MKKLTMMLLAALTSGAVLAAGETGRTPDPKQSARCNDEARAKGLKSEERKAFLKTSMAGAANATSAPQSLSGPEKPALQTSKP